MLKTIKFFSKLRDDYVFLSNFAESPFQIEGYRYKTVEHFYQANKFKGYMKDVFQKILDAKTPNSTKSIARIHESADKKKNFNRWSLWHADKDKVMREAVRAKFDQNPDLKMKLMATGSARLVEANPRDKYWGGVAKQNLNKLGDILMEVRESYKKEQGSIIEKKPSRLSSKKNLEEKKEEEDK